MTCFGVKDARRTPANDFEASHHKTRNRDYGTIKSKRNTVMDKIGSGCILLI